MENMMVEEITKWKSIDGTMHSNLESALKADRIETERLNTDIANVIADYAADVDRLIAREIRQAEKGKPTSYPVVITQYGKHGDDLYIAMSQDGITEALWTIFNRYYHDGYYDFDKVEREIANRINDFEIKKAARTFVMKRNDEHHEYERIEFYRPTVYK
jgi:hypothetical protein